MKADLQATLIDDGRIWIATCENNVTAKGRTLPQLDTDLKQALIDSGRYPKGATVSVFMAFDYSTIPTWIRQYAYHYFNRLVILEL